MNYYNTRACWFNLSALSKDERSIIYRKLDPVDWEIGRVAHNPQYRPNLDIEYIVRNGYLDILIWINDDSLQRKILEYAVIYQQLEILDWLKEIKGYLICISGVIYFATKKGCLDVLKWCGNIGWPRWTWENAAFYGHLDILKWAFPNFDRERVLKEAIRGGHQHILDWLATLPVP